MSAVQTRTMVVATAAAVLLLAAGFIAGRGVRDDDEKSYAPDLTSPSYEPAPPVAGFSRGGFTGFGEVQGFEGRTILGGRIVAVNGASVTVETPGGTQATVRLDPARAPVLLMEGTTRAGLQPGMNVDVIRGEDGRESLSVLVLLQR
jgi:hypothetical protein